MPRKRKPPEPRYVYMEWECPYCDATHNNLWTTDTRPDHVDCKDCGAVIPVRHSDDEETPDETTD